MQFEPKSKQELRAALPDGEYTATVTKAEDTTSKKGNDMIALTLRVYGDNLNVLATDWLIPNTTGLWKVYDFCESAGKMDRYEAGDLTASDCLNAEVVVVLKNEAQEGFEPQPRIKRYLKERSGSKGKSKYETPQEIVARQASTPSPVSSGAPSDGDDIPF